MTRRSRFWIVAMAWVLVAGTAQAQVYERWRSTQSSSFLPAELRKSDVHEVKGRVFTEGYVHEYRVASPYGEFGAPSDAMLRRLVRELHAIKAMKEVTGTSAFADATVEVLKSPYAALKALATDPVATVTGIPKGVGRVFEGVGETLAGDESEYEDNEVEALLTLSKFKRQYAAKLGIDVYSSNPLIQIELNRIGWAAAIGNFTPSILTMPISGPVIVVSKSLDWVDTLNDVLVEEAPSALRVDNLAILVKMGIDEELITRFLDQPLLSPRHKTVIVYALRSLDGVRGREHLLRLALGAESEVQALYFQQLAEMLAGYHRVRTPIAEIRPFRNLVVSKTQSGNLVVMAPLDEGRWTLRAARAMHTLTANPPGGTPNGFELIVTGTLSDRTRKKTQGMGIEVTEKANALFGLLD